MKPTFQLNINVFPINLEISPNEIILTNLF